MAGETRDIGSEISSIRSEVGNARQGHDGGAMTSTGERVSMRMKMGRYREASELRLLREEDERAVILLVTRCCVGAGVQSRAENANRTYENATPWNSSRRFACDSPTLRSSSCCVSESDSGRCTRSIPLRCTRSPIPSISSLFLRGNRGAHPHPPAYLGRHTQVT